LPLNTQGKEEGRKEGMKDRKKERKDIPHRDYISD